MPLGVVQAQRRGLAVLVNRAARTTELVAHLATALGEDTPAAVVRAVPVLVGNEGLVIRLTVELGPEGHREAAGVTELQAARVTEGHVVVDRTILQVVDADGLANRTGFELGRTDRRGDHTLARLVGVGAVERQVDFQVLGDGRHLDALARVAEGEERRGFLGVEGAVPDGDFVEHSVQFGSVIIGVLTGPVLTEVQLEAKVVGIDVTLGGHWAGERQSAVHVGVHVAGAGHSDGDQMPGAVRQVGWRVLAELVSRSVRAGELHADLGTALGENAPTTVVGAVPVLIGNEGLVVGLANLFHPERHGEVLGITKLEGVGVAEGHVVVERTILEVLHVDALTALAGLEGRGAHRLGGDIALQVVVVAIEREVSHQAAAQHGRISQGRADRLNGIGRG